MCTNSEHVNVGDVIMMLQSTPIGHVRYVDWDYALQKDTLDMYEVTGETLCGGDFVTIISDIKTSTSRYIVMTSKGYIGTALITEDEIRNSKSRK